MSLFNAGYFARSHLYWLKSGDEDEAWKCYLKKLHQTGEYVFGYRCDNRMPAPPSGYYWRMMPEHGSMRIYQLELKRDSI